MKSCIAVGRAFYKCIFSSPIATISCTCMHMYTISKQCQTAAVIHCFSDYGYAKEYDWSHICEPDPSITHAPLSIPRYCPEGTTFARTKGSASYSCSLRRLCAWTHDCRDVIACRVHMYVYTTCCQVFLIDVCKFIVRMHLLQVPQGVR